MSESTVLVADNSPTIRKFLELFFKSEGVEVVTATDGHSAWVAVTDRKPDLAIIDVSLEGVDGYQLCQTIRSGVSSKPIPVILLGSKDGLADKIRGRLAGAAELVGKPFDPQSLLTLVQKHVKTSKES